MEAKAESQLLPVRTIGQTLTVSSLDFAQGLGVKHKSLIGTIRTHQAAIESQFGQLAFEVEAATNFAVSTGEINPPATRAGRPQTIAFLTEDQALFVGTLSRNSARVVSFKATLVRSFSQARRQLREVATPWPPIGPMIPAEQMVWHHQRISQLEQQLGQLLTRQQQAAQALLDVPRSSEAVPQETTRTKVQRLVNAYCRARSVPQQDAWRIVYDRLYYAYRISIRRHKKRTERESWLDVAERSGYMEKIYAIVSEEFGQLPAA